MLSQFPLCALETSEAIASVYGSPTKLLEASRNKSILIVIMYILFDI